MTHISGSTKQLLILLEETFAAGFDNGARISDYDKLPSLWEEYKKEHLSNRIWRYLRNLRR